MDKYELKPNFMNPLNGNRIVWLELCMAENTLHHLLVLFSCILLLGILLFVTITLFVIIYALLIYRSDFTLIEIYFVWLFFVKFVYLFVCLFFPQCLHMFTFSCPLLAQWWVLQFILTRVWYTEHIELSEYSNNFEIR